MDWHALADDLGSFLPGPWLHVVLILASVLCGAIVGGEREKRDKPAGLRTLTLVCVGSTTFTLASFAFVTTTGDSGRVAAQIVTGIGFLGAGAILHSAGIIKGMTTAATIWAMAAIGMVVGIGYAGAGLGLSVLVRLVLSVALAIENRAHGGVQSCHVELQFHVDGGKTRVRIEKLMEDFHVLGPLELDQPDADGLVRAILEVQLSRRHRREFLSGVAELAAIRRIAERPA